MIRRPRRKPLGEKVLRAQSPPLRLGQQMSAALAAELKLMTLETRALIKALAGAEGLGMDAPPDGSTISGIAQIHLDSLKERYRQSFTALADMWSRRMIDGVVSQSSAQLTLGLKETAQRFEIQSTLQTPRLRAVVEASTQATVGLITRIPAKYLDAVQTQVMSAITTGSGLGQLVPYLTKRYKGDARHAHLTALDQIRKVSANVNAARIQELGVESYIWVHVGGEKYPRELHQKMNGKVYRYDDPPVIQKAKGSLPEVRGKPGDLIACRCVAKPVLNFSRMREAA